MRHTEVTEQTFAMFFETARRESDLIRNSTSRMLEVTGEPAHYYLGKDFRSGFVVRTTGELVGVFSLERGRGRAIMRDAIRAGATTLDCFDGYLVDFYKSHGFVEVDREPNWTPGGPDVVFMARV